MGYTTELQLAQNNIDDAVRSHIESLEQDPWFKEYSCIASLNHMIALKQDFIYYLTNGGNCDKLRDVLNTMAYQLVEISYCLGIKEKNRASESNSRVFSPQEGGGD